MTSRRQLLVASRSCAGSRELRATDRDAFLAYVIRKITRPW
ncbi:hypothetical protein [Actinophytocola sp.]|nr:hypothetical protein [Actinophytocola sp.]